MFWRIFEAKNKVSGQGFCREQLLVGPTWVLLLNMQTLKHMPQLKEDVILQPDIITLIVLQFLSVFTICNFKLT